MTPSEQRPCDIFAEEPDQEGESNALIHLFCLSTASLFWFAHRTFVFVPIVPRAHGALMVHERGRGKNTCGCLGNPLGSPWDPASGAPRQPIPRAQALALRPRDVIPRVCRLERRDRLRIGTLVRIKASADNRGGDDGRGAVYDVCIRRDDESDAEEAGDDRGAFQCCVLLASAECSADVVRGSA